ncbi:MAG TPA: NADP-dependent oxidoreductase [Solirubrobacteraceae bacterium]
MPTSRKIRLAAYPEGLPKDSDWEITEEEIPDPGEGEVLIENLFVSLDPAMRGWVSPLPSYLPPVQIGEVMRAGTVGKVVASNVEQLPVGTYVNGVLGVQEHVVSGPKGLRVVDPDLAPLPTHLGALGMPGWTAYFGLFDIGAAQPGETVVISAAAGAVGSVAGQLAKAHGCRTVGIAGGPEKCAMLTDTYGFDAAIDYKNDDLRKALKETCPDRVDVYFDNVGGDVLDAVLGRLAMGARIPLCGGISQYNADGERRGPNNYLAMIAARARMEGFLVFDFAKRYDEAIAHLAKLLKEDKLVAREHVVEGIEQFNDALNMLFKGENTGKLALQVGAAG